MNRDVANRERLRIIVISSIRPEPTTAGQLILHRHLVNQAEIEWEYFGAEPSRLTVSSAVRRLVGRLGQTRLYRFAHAFWAWREGRWLDGLLPKIVLSDRQTAILTVAHGDASGAARRFARKHQLPLITFYHDWWPDMPAVHSSVRKLLERQFRQLYRDSAVSFCVSEGMLQALGTNTAAQVLPPIPEQQPAAARKATNPHAPYRLLYCGNLFEYGPMLGEALEELSNSAEVRLEVRGCNPQWPEDLKARAVEAGTWVGFTPRSELNSWLDTASAFLVPMVFEPTLRRRMETSFPSKLPEMAQFGKPLVIWGPEYCSAVRWAQGQRHALCITDPNPTALRKAVEKLAANSEEQRRLAAAAQQAAKTEFNRDKIQAQFMNALRSVVRSPLPAIA